MAVTHTLAVANQKGGVAKTTTVASLGAALAEAGQRVLLVDLDPQACLTFSLGLDPEALDLSVHDVLLGRVSAAMAIRPTDDGVDLLPSTIDLAGSEAMLLTRTGREYALRTALDEVADSYDWVLLDCSPSLGVLTLNALTAADFILSSGAARSAPSVGGHPGFIAAMAALAPQTAVEIRATIAAERDSRLTFAAPRLFEAA